jgi:hypothetical protein
MKLIGGYLLNMKHQPNFRGIYASDDLPKTMRPQENGIINLSGMASRGTHWVAYDNQALSPHVIYFDSFGLVPSLAIRHYLQTAGKPIIYNDQQLQMADSSNCGLFAVYFLKMRNRGSTFADILKTFHQKPHCINELLVQIKK